MSYVTFLQSKDIIRWEGVFDLHTNNIHQLKKVVINVKKTTKVLKVILAGNPQTFIIFVISVTRLIYYLYYVRYLITNCIFLRDLKSGIWDGDFFLLNRFPI